MDIQKDTANDELFGTGIFWWNCIKDVEASNYSTIEARIKDDDLRDIIDYAREAMARVSIGFTRNQNITKAEDILEEMDYLPKNKLMYININ